MRLAIATAFALIVLPAPALKQSVRLDALSLQAGVRARILGPTADSRYILLRSLRPVRIACATAWIQASLPSRSHGNKSVKWTRAWDVSTPSSVGAGEIGRLVMTRLQFTF